MFSFITIYVQEELLSWEMKCELAESELYDTVISATANDHHILIGTYGEVRKFGSNKAYTTYLSQHILVYPRHRSKVDSQICYPLMVILQLKTLFTIFNECTYYRSCVWHHLCYPFFARVIAKT